MNMVKATGKGVLTKSLLLNNNNNNNKFIYENIVSSWQLFNIMEFLFVINV